MRGAKVFCRISDNVVKGKMKTGQKGGEADKTKPNTLRRAA